MNFSQMIARSWYDGYGGALMYSEIGTLALQKKVSEADPSSLLDSVRENVRYAYQPIVSAHTGLAYGFEALLRGHREAGCASIQSLLDALYTSVDPAAADYVLQEKAIHGFAKFNRRTDAKLFYNLDNRLLHAEKYGFDKAFDLLAAYGFQPPSLCIEISEAHVIADPAQVSRVATIAARFYDLETQQAGILRCPDREGEYRNIPLLTASCALLFLSDGARLATPDSMSMALAGLRNWRSIRQRS